jgi:glycosyltransferase involved in cell wall biosynthesis
MIRPEDMEPRHKPSDAGSAAALRSTERPRVSVVIPCYDHGQRLDDAIINVFGQTLQDFQIVVVDDGPIDPVSGPLQRTYQRPKTVVIKGPQRGPGAAKNVGVRAAQGEYVCVLDEDHEFEPTYFERSVEALDADATLGFVSSSIRMLGSEESVWRPDRCDLVTLLAECTVSPAALVRREAIQAVGYYDEDPTGWGHEDWILWITLVERGFRGRILPEALLRYRRRSESRSGFWVQGDARVERMGVVLRRHASYRDHFVDVVLHKEAELCDLLRENDNAERGLSWLERQIELWQNENTRLQRKVDALRSRTYVPGEVVSFIEGGNGDRYTGDGWSWPEGVGTWTDGPRAELFLQFDSPHSGPLELVVRGQAFVTETRPNQDVKVFANDRPIADWTFSFGRDASELSAVIPAELAASRKLKVSFQIADPRSPESLGRSADPRRLGILLQELCARRLPFNDSRT